MLAKDSIMRSNCYWFVQSEMFITEEHLSHLCVYVHLLLVYYSVFNACYISIMGHVSAFIGLLDYLFYFIYLIRSETHQNRAIGNTV